MSWAAQKWAIEQDAGDPTTKLLLVVLASYAAADNSCFPSQETLARKVECSERSIRGHLAKLESLGLIRRHERRKHGGYKLSDLIVLCMSEADEKLDLSTVEISPAKSAGENNSHRQRASFSPAISDNLTGKICWYIEDEPIIEPINEPSCMDGAEFEDLLTAYVPFAPADNRASAIGVWKTLTPDEQADAVCHAKGFCAAIKGEPPYLITYLRERRWTAVSGSTKAIPVEWVEENSPRWREIVAAGKKESLMRMQLRAMNGKQCFPHYEAQPVKQGAAA